MIISAGACASLPSASPHDAYTSLEARLYDPFGGRVQFAVSRPAYVAIFEVNPGGGMRMLFPTTSHHAHHPLFGSYSFSASRGRDAWGVSYLSSDRGRSMWPTYLLLIASERPLRVDRMINAPWALRSELGFATYHAMSPGVHTIERLADRIVQDPDVTEWAYDTYIVWPRDVQTLPAIRVVCADGSVLLLRGTRVPLDCLQPPVQPDSVKPPPSDSAAAAPRLRGHPPRTLPENGGNTIARGGGRSLDDDDMRGRAGERASRASRPGEQRESWSGRAGSRAGRGHSRTAEPERGSARTSGSAREANSGARGDGHRQGRGARAAQPPRNTVSGNRDGAGSTPPRAESQRSSGRESSATPSGDRRSGGRPSSAESRGGEGATQ